MPNRPQVAAAAASLFAIALLVAGCSSGGSSSANASAPLAKEVPASVKSAGVLKVAESFPYEPFQYYVGDSKKQTGIEVDLANQIGKQLGVKVQITNVSFDGVLTGVQGGRYDLAMSGLGVTAARAQAVDFVTDFKTGYTFAVPGKYADTLKTLDDLCGHTVSAGSGTTSVPQVQAQSKKCVSEGKSAITLLQFKDQSSQDLAVTTGKADADMLTYSVAQSFAERNKSQGYVVPKPYAFVDFGIGVKKGDSDMSKAVKDAVNNLIKNGEYSKILKKYGQTSGAITSSKVVTSATVGS
jgi:polar amino acid transport system substrate-binding protein